MPKFSYSTRRPLIQTERVVRLNEQEGRKLKFFIKQQDAALRRQKKQERFDGRRQKVHTAELLKAMELMAASSDKRRRPLGVSPRLFSLIRRLKLVTPDRL